MIVNDLFEENKFDLEQFKKDCAFYIDNLPDNKEQVLYRGEPLNNPDFEIRSFKERSGPRDSSLILHNTLNSVFKDMFGANIRNWLFTTGDLDEALQYSHAIKGVLTIFPIGKFDWVCGISPELKDIAEWETEIYWKIKSQHPMYNVDMLHDMARKEVVKRIPELKWLHNTNLPECIYSKNEVHIKCDKYYAFRAYLTGGVYETQILPYLKSL